MSREPKKPRTRPRGEWCPDESIVDNEGGMIRCPTCGRRLLPHYVLDEGVFHVPRHKTSEVK